MRPASFPVEHAICGLAAKSPRRVFFFFQAEDGIRDLYVTVVQTCALPICAVSLALRPLRRGRARRAKDSRLANLGQCTCRRPDDCERHWASERRRSLGWDVDLRGPPE